MKQDPLQTIAPNEETAAINLLSVAREGTVIGPYALLRQIGSGGMGVVYRSR